MAHLRVTPGDGTVTAPRGDGGGQATTRDRDIALRRWDERRERWQKEVARLEAGLAEAKRTLEVAAKPPARKARAKRAPNPDKTPRTRKRVGPPKD